MEECRYSSNFFTSALDGGEWSASRPRGKSPRYPSDRRLGGLQRRHTTYVRKYWSRVVSVAPVGMYGSYTIFILLGITFLCIKYVALAELNKGLLTLLPLVPHTIKRMRIFAADFLRHRYKYIVTTSSHCPAVSSSNRCSLR
jgi:hypothetical protein